MHRQQQTQQRRHGVHNCVHGTRAYKLGIVMGQHIDAIAI